MKVRSLFANADTTATGYSLRREAANEYFVIDGEARTITAPTTFKHFGVESDENAARVWFECPQIVGDNIDLATLNLRVNFKNANGEKDNYIVKDVEADGLNIRFSWQLSRKVTLYKGTVSFIVCAVKTDSDGKVQNEWNTTLCTGSVLEGLEATSPEIEENTSDLISQLVDMINGATNDVNDAKAEALSYIETAKAISVDEIEEKGNEMYDRLYALPISTVPSTLEANKEYSFGEVSELSLAFPTIANNGDVVYLTFKSGSAATSLTIDTTNTSDIEIIPEANCYYDIFAKFNGSVWLVNYSEYLVSEV